MLPSVFDFVSLPKAEVHIHLEGTMALPPAGSGGAGGIDTAPNIEGPDSGDGRPTTVGLSEFLRLLDRICSQVTTADQLATIARQFTERVASAGTRYADVIVNPTHWAAWRRDVPGLVAGLDAGLREAEQDGLPPVGLCVSLLRTQSKQEADELVDVLVASASPRVVALSVDGNEAASGRTAVKFAEAFRAAKAAGLRATVHAGESSGPEGVRDAVELLGADRIDHGVRAVEDPDLMALLADRRIPLGVCPSSNLTLGLYPALPDHPIERLRAAGVPVSVNTDDPELLGIDLAGEYARCAETFGWGVDVACEVARTSIDAAFCGPDLADRLRSELDRWPNVD
jgi:adenosine deaminase